MPSPENTKCSVYWIHLPEHTDMFSQGYIGITVQDIRVRYSEHKATAKAGKAIISKALLKYKGQTKIKTILVGSVDYCKDFEKRIRPTERIGWNTVCGGGKPPVFRGHSEESKLLIKAASTGRKHTEESKAKMSALHAFRNKVLSEETKLRMSIASLKRIRKPHSAETKLKMSIAHRNRTTIKEINI